MFRVSFNKTKIKFRGVFFFQVQLRRRILRQEVYKFHNHQAKREIWAEGFALLAGT